MAAFSALFIMTGCGQSVPGVSSSTDFNECASINKKLLQVDEYIARVSAMSAFHLEEAAIAIPNLQISTSNNKKDMLKDANRKKAELLAKSQTHGCQPYKKK